MRFYSDVIESKSFPRVLRQLLLVFGGALFLSLLSLIRFPLWFTPVPVTMQTLGVLLIGGFLGSRNGPLATLLFLGAGSLGLPLFAAPLGGATTGYLLGFVFASYAIGRCFELGAARHVVSKIAALIFGLFVIHFAGFLWLGSLIGFQQALVLGFYPFILIDLAKVSVAAAILGTKRLSSV